jgi:hypothetical protein
MSHDRSLERRQLATQRLIFARQMADWKIRASVLGMTQRWLDLAEPCEEPDALYRALRLRAIQRNIGPELRAQLDLPRKMPSLADFLVLSGDFMTIPEDEILKLHPMATYVGGRKVYAAPEANGAF